MRAKGKYIIKATDYNQLMINGDTAIESVNQASFLFASAVYQEMDKIGIRPSYRDIMCSLCDNDSLTQLELVKLTNLKAPMVSITLRSMERDGIVTRIKSETDRREMHVSITDKGRKMYQKMLVSIDRIQKKMTSGLTDIELEQMTSALKKISVNLNGFVV